VIDPDELITVDVWLLVDENGCAAADCSPEQLRDDYRCDHGDLDGGVACRLYKLAVRVPRPRPVPVTCAVTDSMAVANPVV
jgi:hypothetical protein